MKKIIPTASLILIALLFNGCSTDLTNNEDTALMQQIQGTWKLTASYSDDQAVNTPINNGYKISFNSDKTFNSDEENGYSGGAFNIIKSPGKNLKLVYNKQWSAKQVYKYINQVDELHIYLQASNPEPTKDGQAFFTGYILTRVP